MATHKYGEIKYNIGFNIDNKGIQQLKDQLKEIRTMTTPEFQAISGFKGTSDEAFRELRRIKDEARDVEKALKESFNPKIGVSNLTEFSKAIKNIGIDKLAEDLNKLGPAGSAAFNSLNMGLMTTNTYVKRTTKLLDEMATSFKNTVKWGISSSAFNTMTNAVQKSWQYAKALDSSLNDIQIVANKSANDMERFAKQANKAAQELGASTLDYTKGALIYYQQGLSDEEVKERTDVTLKMANVLGTSAQEISNYMTAIWNNFDDGSQSLEHYADVITALGAATASSSEEIATGLEKFAAIGDTVGLSYEYATSALATVVAKTRQSADTVGTAFKTLFARIQDLELGDTLDDGTTLGKYAEALDKVGINIKDTSGELKKMDDILDEMGKKWQTLNKDQQVALAQSVAGTRQYSQLIALMDNWDEFRKNLNIAGDATGTLQKQQETYLQSTQAHLEKLSAAAERFKSSLFDKNATNGLIDGLSQVINLFASFNESIGGGSNLLLALGSTGMQVFGNQIAEGIGQTIKKLEEAKQKASDLKTAFENTEETKKYIDILNTGTGVEDTLKDWVEKRELYKTSLTEHQMQELEAFIQELNSEINNYAQKSLAIDKAFEMFKNFQKEGEEFAEDSTPGDVKKQDVNKLQAEYGTEFLKPILEAEEKVRGAWNVFYNDDDWEKALSDTNDIYDDYILALDNFIRRYKNILSEETINWIETSYEKFNDTRRLQQSIINELLEKGFLNPEEKISLNTVYKQNKNLGPKTKDESAIINTNLAMTSAREQVETQLKEMKENLASWKEEVGEDLKEIDKNIENITRKGNEKLQDLKHIVDAKILINIASGLGQIGSALKSFTNVKNILTNNEISTWEKFTQIMMALGTSVALVARGFSSVSNALTQINKNNVANIAAQLTERKKKLEDQVNEGEEAKKTIEALEKKVKEMREKVNQNKKTEQEAKSWEDSYADWIGMPKKSKITDEMREAWKTDNGELLKAQEDLGKAQKTVAIGEKAKKQLGKIPENTKAYTDPKGVQQIVSSGLAGIKGLASAGLAALQSLWAALVPFLPMIALIGAAIAALTLIIYAGVKAWNKDKDAAKAARKDVESLSAAYDECADKANKLKDAISDYKEGLKQLEELTKGTEEYKEALEASNKNAKELIETYKLFGKYKIENGRIIIDENALEEAQEKADTQVNNLNASLAIAKTRSTQADLKSQTTDLKRQSNLALSGFSDEDWESIIKSLSEWDELTIADSAAIKEHLQAEQDLTENGKNNLDKLFDSSGVLKDGILELATATKEAADSMKYYESQFAGDVVQEKYGEDIEKLVTDSEGKVNESRAKQIQAVLTKASEGTIVENDKTLSELLKEINVDSVTSNRKLNKVFKNTGFDESIGDDKDLALTYAKIIKGLDTTNLQYYGGNNKGTVKDNQGNTIFENKSDTEMRRELAIYAEQQNLSKKFGDELNQSDLIKNLGKVMQSAQDFGRKYGTDFTDALLNSLAQGKQTKIDLSSIYGDLSEEEITKISGLSSQDLLKSLGLTESTLKQVGYDSAEQFALAFKNGLLDYKWDADKALDNVLNGREDEYKAIDLDTEEVKKYSKYLMDISDTQKDLADSMEQDANAATIVTQSIMRMNNGIEKLADNWEEWSDILKKSEKTSEEYYDALSNIQDAMGDLLDVSDEYITDDFVNKHMEEIGKAAQGDAEAIDNLHRALAKDIVLNIATNNKDLFEDINIESLTEKINNIKIPDIQVGASMDFTQMNSDMQTFTKAMIDIVNSAHMTADEANAFFGQMGFEAKFATTPQTITNSVPEMTTETEIESIFPLKTKSTTYQSGTKEVAMTVDVPALSTNGEEPKISLTKKATGSYNNYSSKNAGGKSAGGGSDPSKKDAIKTEIDRYHKVNTQITKVDNSLKKLQSQQEKFVGSKLLSNLNAQWADLNTQIENYNEKLRIANEEQAELANKLSSKGVIFNADGTVNNYAEAIRAQEAYVNSLIDNYNHMSADAQKKYEESTLKPAEEAFEQFKTDIDRYDELISSFIPDIKQSIQDSLDKQIEINITKFNLEIEITLDMDQATRDWNAWAKRAIQGFDAEDIFGNAQARLKDFYTYFNEQGTADIQVGMKHVNEALEEFRKMNAGEDSIYGSTKAEYNRAKAIDDLKEHYTQLMQSITDVIELQDELHQDWLDKMDEVQEKFSKQVSAYEFLRNVLDHDIKLIQMNLGEDAYAEMAKFYDAQQKNYEKQLEFQRQQKDFWYAQMQAAEEGSKEWESAREKWQDAVNEFNSILESGLENAKTKFENAINDIFKKLNDSLTGGLGLEYVNTQWDLINKNADRYLDTINSTYAIRELEKKYVDSINKTNSVATQQRLQKVMDEQLENLKQRERLTQYDVDRANKLYEIEMARIALEEAQKNKSQMRLRRDSQGNYSYQYVADDAAISEAEDQLSGLYNDLYNFDKERYNSVLNDIYSTWSEYQEQMAAAALINDPELRAEKQALIQKEYNELMMQIETDYQTIKYNLQESFFTDWVNLNDMTLESFKNLTDNEKDIIMTEMVPTWKNGITEMIEMITGEGGFAAVTQSAWENMVAAEKEYTQDITNLEDVSKQTFDAIAQGQDENIARSQELIKQNDELIDAYGKELQAVKEIYDQVKALRDMFKETEQAAIATAEAAYKALHQEQEQAQSDYANQNTSTSSSSSNPSGSSDITSGVTSGGGAGGSGNGSPEVGDTATYNGGKYYSTSYGGGSWGSRSSGTQVRITIVKAGRPYPIHIANLNGGALGWIREDQISGYDTGGYTGTWNNNGRLALLHQKELVLNAQDTENMLNAVSVMRSLAYSLGSSVLARMAGVGANGINGRGATDGVLEQNVHIEAEFPNVHNAAEIEEALNNLVNSASQRVMEKR